MKPGNTKHEEPKITISEYINLTWKRQHEVLKECLIEDLFGAECKKKEAEGPNE